MAVDTFIDGKPFLESIGILHTSLGAVVGMGSPGVSKGMIEVGGPVIRAISCMPDVVPQGEGTG